MAAQRFPWNHEPNHCAICGKVGPRTWSKAGLVHKYCIPAEEMRERRKAEREATKQAIVNRAK